MIFRERTTRPQGCNNRVLVILCDENVVAAGRTNAEITDILKKQIDGKSHGLYLEIIRLYIICSMLWLITAYRTSLL